MSKHFGFLFGAAVFVSMAFAMALPDPARADNTAEEMCDYYVSIGYFDNKGACMQSVKTGPVKYCKFLKEHGLFDRSDTLWSNTYKNQGDCVSEYKGWGY